MKVTSNCNALLFKVTSPALHPIYMSGPGYRLVSRSFDTRAIVWGFTVTGYKCACVCRPSLNNLHLTTSLWYSSHTFSRTKLRPFEHQQLQHCRTMCHTGPRRPSPTGVSLQVTKLRSSSAHSQTRHVSRTQHPRGLWKRCADSCHPSSACCLTNLSPLAVSRRSQRRP